MIKIVSHGVNPTKEQIEKLVVSAVEIVLPKEEYRGTDHVTDYWVFYRNHKRCIYFGTPETFDKWQRGQVN